MQTIILVMSYAEFFKVCFNGLDLFILLMHKVILRQLHVIHTYISCCFILVRDICLATLNTNYAIIADF